MVNSSHKTRISGTIIIIISAVSFLLYAFSTGITGKTLKNGIGCDCHGSASDDVNVVISGPDTLMTGETATYTLTITGGDLVRGGTNIAASNGALAPVSGDLQLIGDELTHTGPKAPSAAAVTFEFTYTAPATAGGQTLFANGNSVNFNGTNTGDKWNFAPSKVVNVITVTGVEDQLNAMRYELKQNYPNPFNPSTKISFTLPTAGSTEISVYNSLGEKVQEIFSGYLANGTHTVDFNASNLPSGIYYYKMIAGNFISIKKMMLVK